jgi:hypothetical protein
MHVGTVRLRAGARWEVTPISRYMLKSKGVPEDIARIAEWASSKVPGSTLFIGELKREKVVLDSYITIRHNGTEVCLGIWDEVTIACAELT